MPALPVRPSFSQLQKQAKTLRKDCQSGAESALLRLRQYHPDYADTGAASCAQLSLRDAQLAVAREYGEDSWKALKEKATGEAEKSSHEEIRAQRIAQQTSPPDEIERVIRATSGSGVRRSERIAHGSSCEVHWVTTNDGQELMYRANWYNPADDPHFENEKWALLRCAEANIAAPRFRYIEHGLPGYPTRSVIVTERVPGQTLRQLLDAGTLSDAEFHRILREVGALLGELHQIPTEGFGPLDGSGRGPHRSWRAAYVDERLDLERLRQSTANADLPWSLVEEGLQLLERHADLGDKVAPNLLQGDSKPEHIIVDAGHVSGLIDFEYCQGGDPADEAGWSGETTGGSWWDAFTGEKTPTYPTRPLIKGYNQTNSFDKAVQQRGHLIAFANALGGLCYHGVNDINIAGMMDFLNERYRKDLEKAQQILD